MFVPMGNNFTTSFCSWFPREAFLQSSTKRTKFVDIEDSFVTCLHCSSTITHVMCHEKFCVSAQVKFTLWGERAIEVTGGNASPIKWHVIWWKTCFSSSTCRIQKSFFFVFWWLPHKKMFLWFMWRGSQVVYSEFFKQETRTLLHSRKIAEAHVLRAIKHSDR